MELRRSRSFTYQVTDLAPLARRPVDIGHLSRPTAFQLVPVRVIPVQSYPVLWQERKRSAPVWASLRPYSVVPPLTRKRRVYSFDSADPMTRLVFSPASGGSPQPRPSITRSTSISSIPSLCTYYPSHLNLTHLNTTSANTLQRSEPHHRRDHPQHTLQLSHHHTLQPSHHPHQRLSYSSTNIMAAVPETPTRGATISRSQSFGGITHSAHKSSPNPSVLGDNMKKSNGVYSRVQTRLRSFRKSPKMPKLPNPSRTLMIFDCVKRGMRDFIEMTHEEIAELIGTDSSLPKSQGKQLETEKKMKAAERYLKKLECHLAKIDELHDSYLLNQQLREGARNMAKAFSTSNLNSRKDSLASVKYGYKECSQAMCAVEAQLEGLLGTFSCSLKGIAGFARVMPGDVFEVILKHGDQKWKTKGKIQKDNTQRWEAPETTFKCLMGEMLSIKVSEVRAFKSVQLGEKNCEIWNLSAGEEPRSGLFSAQPQLMTASINVHGSLKISLVVVWNPMDNTDKSVTFLQNLVQPVVPSNQRRPVSMYSSIGSLSSSCMDLPSQTSRIFTSPVHALRQREDSGIFGSAASLPNHGMGGKTTPPRRLYETPTHHITGHSRNHSHILNIPNSRTGDVAWKSNFHLARMQPQSFSAIDIRHVGIQDQPIQTTLEFSDSSGSPRSSVSTESPDKMTSSLSSASVITSSEPSSSTPALKPPPTTKVVPTSLNTAVTPPVAELLVPGVVVELIAPYDSHTSVGDALRGLMTNMEDFLGQYPELQKLEEVVHAIEALVKKAQTITPSRSPSVSLSIEGTIEEAFHFLNTEDLLDDIDEEDEAGTDEAKQVTEKTSDIEQIVISPNSTAKTADSGIESLAQRLQEDIHLGSSGGSSPVPLCSGNDKIDQALAFHLTYCDKLLMNLGNFGPLKCREFYALEHLQNQAQVLEKLLALAKSGVEVDLHAVLADETSDKSLRELWVLCVDENPLCVHPNKIISVFEQKFGSRLLEKYDVDPVRTFHHIMARMLYVSSYIPESAGPSIITLHQLMLFFRNVEVLKKLEEISQELSLISALNSTSTDVTLKAVSNMREDLPPPACLKTLTKLLLSSSRDIQQSAVTYFKKMNKVKVSRDKAMVVLVEGLEDHIPEVRAGCCVALSHLEAEECLNQLLHISQSDTSSTVRKKARDVLYSLGEIGRKALQEAQLSSQGFQGLHVNTLTKIKL